ncbi:MAG TPA: GxxExxY protein, partial [bacterium]|nr:GxxExxY protein [bacterium]
CPIVIRYQNEVVGEYTADLLVENRVLVELKATEKLSSIHSAQCLNYLKATGLSACLLMNFGELKLKIRRLTHHL